MSSMQILKEAEEQGIELTPLQRSVVEGNLYHFKAELDGSKQIEFLKGKLPSVSVPTHNLIYIFKDGRTMADFFLSANIVDIY